LPLTFFIEIGFPTVIVLTDNVIKLKIRWF